MKDFTIPLADLLAKAKVHAAAATRRPLPEAQVMTLNEVFAAYSKPCPFKPGDIVTPRKTSRYSDVGMPHVVLEVAETPIRNFVATEDLSDITSSAFGARLDIRVALVTDDDGSVGYSDYHVETGS